MPFLLAPLTLLAASALCYAQPDREHTTLSVGETGRRIVTYVEEAQATGFSGTVLAAKGGEVIAAVGVGTADLAGTQPVTPSTLFEIASVTKSFTAAAVMRLVQDGQLGLDDPISRYLPGVPDSCAAITPRHLLQHTSGIPGSNAMGGGDDVTKVMPSFLSGGPRHPPGTHWEYWNQGYSLLTEVIALAAGKPYTEYCRETLFHPAGMTLTRFTGDEPPEGASVAIGRSARGAPRSALDHPYGSYGFQYRGMGGVVTSVWDLWRWDRALHGEAILDAASKGRLFEPGLNQYALGWFVRTDTGGRLVQTHGGGVRGFICEVRRYPEEDACLFVLCNRDDAPLRQVTTGVEKILFGEPPADEEPRQPLDDELAQALAGRYKDAKGTTLTVETTGGITRAKVHWFPPDGPVTEALLERHSDGAVVLYDGADVIKVTIDRDEAGSVRGVTVQGQAFERVP